MRVVVSDTIWRKEFPVAFDAFLDTSCARLGERLLARVSCAPWRPSRLSGHRVWHGLGRGRGVDGDRVRSARWRSHAQSCEPGVLPQRRQQWPFG